MLSDSMLLVTQLQLARSQDLLLSLKTLLIRDLKPLNLSLTLTLMFYNFVSLERTFIIMVNGSMDNAMELVNYTSPIKVPIMENSIMAEQKDMVGFAIQMEIFI